MHLHHADRLIPLKPADSLIEVLFEQVLTGHDGAEKWKKVNDIWAGEAIKIEIVVEGAKGSVIDLDTPISSD